jgi:glycosyltransferase involved in cell wall biosynthesis
MTSDSFVFFSAVRYDHCLSGRTRRLADALACMGHDVTFVEMPSLKAAASRLCHRNNSGRDDPGPRIVRLPPFPAFLKLHATSPARLWVRFLRRQLAAKIPNLERAVVIVSTPWWLPILKDLPRGLLCYDYIDHLSVHSGVRHARIMSDWDDELLGMSDVVTAVSETLRRSLGRRLDPARIRLVPNGVESAWLDSPIDPIPRSVITGGVDRPIAGFIGALFEWVDIPLLTATAAAMPDTVFALAGPTRLGVDLAPLRQFDTIRCFPAQPYDDVPRWIRAFDVCLIPFKNDIISHCADPIKLYEYLALGKPVVTSVPFGIPGDPAPMLVADGPGQFADCIRKCLCETNSHDERIAYARRHTWERRASDLLELIRQRCCDPVLLGA